MINQYFCVFYAEHLYYLPQFLPVARELKEQGYSFLFLFNPTKKRDLFNPEGIIKEVCEKEDLPFIFSQEDLKGVETEWLICGGNSFPAVSFPFKKSALLTHGIGTKSGYFEPEQLKYDVRFVEGAYRLAKLQELFPSANTHFENVGFAKLDSVFHYTKEEKEQLLAGWGLDPSKPTILYAPTFYPSSIERMKKSFPKEMKDFNILVKPHSYTYMRQKYEGQRNLLEKWGREKNVFVADFTDYNLVPFLAAADIMVSDESSAMFEFAALDKPVICNRFLKLRLSYRLWGKRKLKKRLDPIIDKYRQVAANADSYSEMLRMIREAHKEPSRDSEIRRKMTHEIVGPVDGKASQRIVTCLKQNR